MTLFSKKDNTQVASAHSVNANDSLLENVNNRYNINNYGQVIVKFITKASNDFHDFLPSDLDISNPNIAKKVSALQMGYIQNLDIDEQIKQIYDQCHRICIKQLHDDYSLVSEFKN